MQRFAAVRAACRKQKTPQHQEPTLNGGEGGRGSDTVPSIGLNSAQKGNLFRLQEKAFSKAFPGFCKADHTM